jgi:hypothetical protein
VEWLVAAIGRGDVTEWEQLSRGIGNLLSEDRESWRGINWKRGFSVHDKFRTEKANAWGAARVM